MERSRFGHEELKTAGGLTEQGPQRGPGRTNAWQSLPHMYNNLAWILGQAYQGEGRGLGQVAICQGLTLLEGIHSLV